MFTKFLLAGFILVSHAKATTWYVDSSAAGAHNGTSWANAWTRLDQITGVNPGDTVYISGGPTESTKTYNLSSAWTAISGSASARITYTIGREPQHNGTAVFNAPNSSFIDKSRGGIDQVVIDGSAGDGKQHFKLDNVARGIIDCPSGYFTNSRFAYVDCGDKVPGGFYLTETSHLEIDHIYFKEARPSPTGAESVMYATSGDEAFDSNKIHDNHFIAPVSDNVADGNGGGSGNDLLRIDGSGWSIYNNVLEHNPVPGYPPDHQHADGLQCLGAHYYKVYNNVFHNIVNYAVYFTQEQGNWQHLYVYNNILIIDKDWCMTRQGNAGLVFGFDKPSNDVHIENNLVADYGWHGWGCIDSPDHRDWASPNFEKAGLVDNCSLKNNVVLNNSSGVNFTAGTYGIDTAVQSSNNVLMDGSSAPNTFVSYAPFGAENDYHLMPTDTMLKGKGIDSSARFAIDKDGLTRVNPWDIGPYRFVSQTQTVYRLFASSEQPTESVRDNPVNLGVQFTPKVNGQVTGITFFKAPGEQPSETASSHTVTLWSASGFRLAEATTTTEPQAGWVGVEFTSPVSVTAGATYVASYLSDGRYAYTHDYFTSAKVRGPLVATATTNGVFHYATMPLFPGESYRSANYWVDVDFVTP